MKIAICDNDTAFSYKLKHLLYAYSNLHKLDFLVETFNSGEALLKSQNRYLLIFIEYSLSGINGLETAKEIRRQNSNIKIIFVTQNTQFIFEVFNISAYRFLSKPLCEKTLNKTLNDLFFNTGIHYPIWINDGFTTHCVDTAEIAYLEADNKYCYIHLNDNVILCKKTMARVFEALPKTYFHKIHRSFVVNFNYINKYNSDSVFLKNGEDLQITRTFYKDFQKNYIEYCCPKII